MPCLNARIESIGPIVEIGISRPSDQDDPTAIDEIVWIWALVDTGCSDTSVHRSVVERCGLKLVGADIVRTGAGPVKVNLFAGDLFLRSTPDGAHDTSFSERWFAEIVDDNPEFDAILGMDILGRGVFILQGRPRNLLLVASPWC